MANHSSPKEQIPPPRDGWADALAEARELGEPSLEERYELLAAACRAVFQILEGHPDRAAILAYQEPLSDASRALIARARIAGDF